MLNYLDLFHGIGGFALGAYWAGVKFENHFCSDIEPFAVELYKKRFPDSVQLGDITKIDWHKLKKDYPGEWIISGGFPCQDISVAGKGRGLIDEKTGKKTRSGLWYNYSDAIRILQPKFAIIENVGALYNRGLREVLASITEIRYAAEWQSISARQVGAKHKRERIWIICYPDIEPSNKTSKQTMPIRSERKTWRDNGNVDRETSPGVYWEKNSSEFLRVDDGLSQSMDRRKGLGNAIVPQIAEILFNLIKD